MYRIALADHAFDKHSGIDPSHSVMRLCHVEQDALLRLAGLGSLIFDLFLSRDGPKGTALRAVTLRPIGSSDLIGIVLPAADAAQSILDANVAGFAGQSITTTRPQISRMP
jgi:hypothetical protein